MMEYLGVDVPFEIGDYLTDTDFQLDFPTKEISLEEFQKFRSELLRANYCIHKTKLKHWLAKYQVYKSALKKLKDNYRELEKTGISNVKHVTLSPDVNPPDLLSKLRQANRKSSRLFRFNDKHRRIHQNKIMMELKGINNQLKKIYKTNQNIIKIQQNLFG